ncbi:uncharacterized protein LOC752620 isoform X2 [Strongylocentrotus purpuratus]|uniref:DUF4430 domain-containing protein n=1 Tax=Strongylocentrotus purpuratus TaxID=7668 RepID=A0A7M7T4Q4_STRPU|nr:uncharacterized protein LOC752620 isoform X2 [Strongylocentrotus purpuratus]
MRAWSRWCYMANLNSEYGHFITTINGVTAADGYFWAIFDGEGIATPVGVDALVLEDGDSYIFNYMYYNASSPTIANYTGPCLNAPVIPANMPLTYLSTFITVADDNTDNVKAGTNFEPVCNQLVLFDQSQPSLYDVMMLVNNQIPLDIRVTLDTSNMTVMTLNDITNQGGYAWTPFNVKTNMKLPRDLSMTQLSDGDQIRFVFAEVNDEAEVNDDDEGDEFECEALPGGEVPKITNFISADNSFNGTTICMMQYEVPQGANLWQGMMAASQQQGDNFTYMATVHPIYGHFITTINGVTGAAGYFWAIFDGEGIATPVGVDWLVLEDGDSYIFNYMYAPPYNASNPDHVIANYTGPCLNAPVISANMPLTYLSTFITVADDNTENVKAGTNFEPVCNQLVLFDQSQPSLYDVMMLVNMQIPLDIRVTVDTSNMTVMTLNNITNQGGYAWTPFNVKTNMKLPRDLSMTQLSDGDQIRFDFAEVEDDEDDDMSSGVETTMSVILLLSSVFMAFFI